MLRFVKRHFIIVMVAAFFASVYLGLSFGTTFINIFSFPWLDEIHRQLLLLRFYKIIMAFTVGGALAVAGAGYQAILRNPLAEPFILGVSGGASVGAAVSIVLGLPAIFFMALPLSAFAGAVVVLLIVISLARIDGANYSSNIMISGIIISTVCTSILMFMVSFMNSEKLNSITWWMLGNLDPDDIGFLLLIFSLVVIGTLIVFLYGRHINVVSLGDEIAHGLGVSPVRLSLVVLGISSFITAAVVSISGIIGFVGLIVPHVVRKTTGSGDHRVLFPFCFVFGGIFLVLCDTLARVVISPQVLPVGVVTAIAGGPFFLWVLNRKGNS